MSHIAVVEGSVRWVRQLTGLWERSGHPTPVTALNRETTERSGMVGTDLGSSFYDGERLWFLFGDTWPDPWLGDCFASTTDTNPEDALLLDIPRGVDGSWKRPNVSGANRPDGVFTTREFEVPTGGFALGDRRYVVLTNGHHSEVVDGVIHEVMETSALCRQRDGASDLADLRWIFDISHDADLGRFINASPVVVPDPPPGLKFDGPAVFFWGSGRYRHSQCYLASVPATNESVEHPELWWFFAGFNPDGSPRWEAEQEQAATLFTPIPPDEKDGGIGELSVVWVAPLRVWLLTYGGVIFRTAPRPWGPWSEPQTLDNAGKPAISYGKLLHRSWDVGGPDGTDLLYDRGRGMDGGGPYGPYLIDRFTRGVGRAGAQIWFTLSTWNPYQVHLMTAVLERRPGELRLDPGRPLPIGKRPADIDLDPSAGGRLGRGSPAEIELDPPGGGLLGGGPGDIEPDAPRLVLPTGGLSMVRSRFGPAANNFELIVPSTRSGLLFVAAATDPWPPAWGVTTGVGFGPKEPVRYTAASIAIAVTPDPDPRHADRPKGAIRDRLMVAAVTGDRPVYLYRDAKEPWAWHGPYPIIAVENDDRRYPLTSVRGNPALIGSTHGALKANFELIVPDAHAGIRHYWFDNDPGFPLSGDWKLAPDFGSALGRVDAVAVFQSVFGNAERGNLEVLVRRAGELHLFWRDATSTWQGPFPLICEGIAVTAATGVPAFVQSQYGLRRNDFQLVTPWQNGGLAYFWRDNSAVDAALYRWHGPAIIDPGTIYLAASLVSGPFGPDPGNLELVATAGNGTIRHFYRESTSPAWHEAGIVPL